MNLIILCLTFILLGLLFFWTQRRPRNFPPGPQWYPIVGNSIQLRRTAGKLGCTQLVYEQWSRELGNPHVIGFRLGGKFFVIGTSAKAVTEIYRNPLFAGRPKDLFTYIRTLETFGGITFTDGDLWKEHRCFTVKRLKSLGFGCGYMQGLIEKELSAFKEVIQEEMAREGSLWPGEFLKESVMNVLWTIVAGNDAEHRVLSKTLMNLLEKRLKNFDISGGALSDFPWLRFIAPEYSGYNLLCQINKEITSILKKIISVHQKRFSEEKANENLIYAFIEEMRKQETKKGSTFTEKQLMVVMMDFIIGGSYSTRATFDLSLMTLALYPDIQEEIHAEIVKATPLNSSNFHSGDLPLCQAFLMEIARFYSIVPTTGPRRAFAETQLCGYIIPKDTTILIGNEFVHMDRTFWNDPEIFRPSRFLNEGKTKIINSDRVHQFGQGKRMCLGVPLAKSFLHTFLTGIVQDYRISPAPGKEPPSQNLIPGLFKTIKPYQVQFIRRF